METHASDSRQISRRVISLVVDDVVTAMRIAKNRATWESGLRRWVNRPLDEAGEARVSECG